MRIKTYAEAKAIKKPGFYRAGDTLYLRVGNNGTKSWIQRLTIDGKRHDIGLGSFKLVTFAEARDMAFENRKEARIHKRAPLAEKRKAKIPTFREAALQTYEALKPRWRSGKHTRNWLQIMEKYAIPIIGLTLPLFLYHEPLSYCTSSRCWIAARHYDAGRYSLQRLAGIRL